jgi:hypothetical protein
MITQSRHKGVYNVGRHAIIVMKPEGELGMKIISVAAVMLLLLNLAVAQQSPKPSSLDDLRFLIGEWEGVGEGGPGSGKGVFSFAFDLQNKAIVRKNYAEYPPTASRPAIRHDDLIVIYLDRASNQILANYFDSEGQQIAYKVTPSSDHEALTFLSDASATQPRYRLSYLKLKNGTSSGRFEIAPPGQSEVFKTYLEWTARKK